MPAPQTVPFADAHLEKAGRLLTARHRSHRRAEPLLAERFEEPEGARAEVEALWACAGASGAVATAGGRLTGFLLGTPRTGELWGPNMWVESAGHAVQDCRPCSRAGSR